MALASCPLSQPLEVRTTRDLLRDAVLGGTLSPQIVIRLGWPASDVALPEAPVGPRQRPSVSCHAEPAAKRSHQPVVQRHLRGLPDAHPVATSSQARTSDRSTTAERKPT